MTFGTKKVFNSSTSYYTSTVYLDSTHFVVAYTDYGNNEYGTAIVGTISGTTITYGTAKVFSFVSSRDFCIDRLSSTSFVIGYIDQASNIGKAVVGTISGTTITYGTAKVFNSTLSYLNSISVLDSTHFVLTYSETYSTAIIGTISGTTILFGTAKVLFNYSNSTYSKALDSTHFVTIYKDGDNLDYGTSRLCTVSGTNISVGAAKIFYSGDSSISNPPTKLSSTSFVVVYRDNDDEQHGKAIIGTVSGTTITYGTTKEFCNAAIAYQEITTLSSTSFVVIYRDGGNTYDGTAIIGTISGTSILFGTSSAFETNNYSYATVSALDSTNFIINYSNGGNSGYGTGVVGKLSTFPYMRINIGDTWKTLA